MPTHLFLDFGTAYCKAATCKPGEPPVPLAIGEAVRQGRGDRHMIRTALFIARSGRIYFGEAAVDTAAKEDRLPYDDIKDVLTSAKRRTDLDEALPDNPTAVRITKRDAITLFLAFFTQAALRARGGPRTKVRRSIAMPVFGKEKQKWVSKELTNALVQAHALARHFGDSVFDSVDLEEGIRVLAKRSDRGVVADPPTVTEPIAAIAGHLLHYTPDGRGAPGLMMVLDVGAGTTDIAMFAKGEADSVVTIRHVDRSKISLPWAGRAIDRAFIDDLVANGNGGDRLRADLRREGNGQPIKEEMFERRIVTRARHGISRSLEDFLKSKAMLRVVTEIQRGFDNVLLDVDRSFFERQAVVRFSGGGYNLPFLAELIEAERYIGVDPRQRRTRVRMARATPHPPWKDQLGFLDLYNEVGRKFHRMAVALGGAYYCADARTWLRLEDDMRSLGSREGSTRSSQRLTPGQ